jgi:hypothetical protein
VESTITIQQVADWARTFPSVVPTLGVAGLGAQPALTIAQNSLQVILGPSMNWKWNRLAVPQFYSGAYQQDYSSSITNLAWLESGVRILYRPSPPPEIFPVACVKDLPILGTQDYAHAVCTLPNSLAQAGTWAANTAYTNPAGLTSIPNCPINQIRDSNGNLQIITTYGTSGATQPVWSTTIGGTTVDGTVVWTMLDPNGITFRFDCQLPPNAMMWSYSLFYQAKPAKYTALSDVIGIPDELAYVFNEVFLAQCFRQSGDPRWPQQEQNAMLKIAEALGSADREPDWYGMTPDIMIIG